MDTVTIDTTALAGLVLALLALGILLGAAMGYYAASSDAQGRLERTNRQLNSLTTPRHLRRSPEPVKENH